MVRTVITHAGSDIHLSIPKEYIGKTIEVTYLSLDELVNNNSNLVHSAESDQSLADKNENNSKYDEKYIKELRNKARHSWIGSIKPDDWLKEMREGYE